MVRMSFRPALLSLLKRSKCSMRSIKTCRARPSCRKILIAKKRSPGPRGSSPSSVDGADTLPISRQDPLHSTMAWPVSRLSPADGLSKMCRCPSAFAGHDTEVIHLVLDGPLDLNRDALRSGGREHDASEWAMMLERGLPGGAVMKLLRRRFLQVAGAAAAGPVLSQHARALDYPVKPIRWIVGYPAGGSADTVSRILAQWLTERLGQPVIIENKPGAATNISLQAAISSPPDGYTMVYLGTSATVNPSFFESLPFNVLRDIAPVSGVADFPFVFVVNKSIQSKN